MPSGVVHWSADTSPPGADLAAAFIQRSRSGAGRVSRVGSVITLQSSQKQRPRTTDKLESRRKKPCEFAKLAKMTKAFMGVRLKTLREQQGLTQAALAASLRISPSYLNQIENDQRPLTVPVLLRLQAAHGIDLQLFSDDAGARRLSELRSVFSDHPDAHPVPLAEAKVVASQLPSVATVLLHLHKRSRAAEERLSSIVAGTDGDRMAGDAAPPLQPYEEVREFFYARHHHMAVLDERAEQLYEAVTEGSRESAIGAAELLV